MEEKQKKAPRRRYEPRYTGAIHLRLTEDEHRLVCEQARAAGCTLSQAARSIIFKRTMAPLDGVSETRMRQLRLLALRSARDECKRMGVMAEAVTEAYLESVKAGRADGVQAERTVRSLAAMLGRINTALNECLAREDEDAVTLSEKLLSENEAAGKDSKKLMIKYTNMERVMIIGVLAEDATIYTKATNGVEKLRMKVVCESLGKGGAKVTRTYMAFSRDVDAMSVMKKGVSVFVEGGYGEGDDGEKMIFADVIKLAGERR